MFNIEREIVKSNHAYMATFWQGYNAAACGAAFDANRSQAWQLGYRFFEKENAPRILNLMREEGTYWNINRTGNAWWRTTSAEDARLDDPRHETGSNR